MMMLVKTTCPFCGEDNYIQVDAEEYARWANGELIQVAMPDLNENEREMLISGICPWCWDDLFEKEEDEDEEDFDDSVDEMGFDPYMGCYSFDC